MNCDVVVVGRVVGVVGAIGVEVVFEDGGFELDNPKISPRATPVSSNIIDNDAQMILSTTKSLGI